MFKRRKKRKDKSEKPAEIQDLGAPYWELSGRVDPEIVVRNLHRLLPEGSGLVVEGTSATRDIQDFLGSKQPPACPSVRLETQRALVFDGQRPIWRKAKAFHLPVTEENLQQLADLMQHHALPEVFDHLKAYKDKRMLLAWYDADPKEPLCVDLSIEEERVKAFCQLLGCQYKRVTENVAE